MDRIHFDYLRHKKACRLKELYDADFTERKNLEVWKGSNATVLPLRSIEEDALLFGRGGVVDNSGNYVESSAIARRMQGRYEFDNAIYKDEKVVYCGYLVNHWGHFLIEAVARLWYFLENDESVDKYVFFIEEGSQREISGNYREFLKLLQIWEKIEIINRPTTYREVIVPELGYKWRTYYSQNYKNIFETIASNVVVDPSWTPLEKIYLSRSQWAKANGTEFGLESLDDFFTRNGYTVLFPEKLPLGQMVYYIRNAKICATVSGTLPHNMLFGKDGQETVILERCAMNNEIQVDINIAKKSRVNYIDANICIYSVNAYGPFIMTYNSQLQKFAEDNKMVPPDSRFCTEKYLKSCFKKYMKAYNSEYRYQWFMQYWYVGNTDCLWEAYCDGYAQYGDYLSGKKPFLFSHYFSWHYIKQFIKRLIGKFR